MWMASPTSAYLPLRNGSRNMGVTPLSCNVVDPRGTGCRIDAHVCVHTKLPGDGMSIGQFTSTLVDEDAMAVVVGYFGCSHAIYKPFDARQRCLTKPTYTNSANHR